VTSRHRIILFCVLSFLGGALLTAGLGYLELLPAMQLFGAAPLLNASSNAELDVIMLKKLRSGDSAGTIKMLDPLLDSHIITLGSYLDSSDPDLRAAAAKALNEIGDYRREFPTTQPDRATRELIEGNLAAARKAGAH
jgi:hypothetical protein